MANCKAIGCNGQTLPDKDFCLECTKEISATTKVLQLNEHLSLSDKYPNYFKKVGELTEIDVYAVHHLFNIQDPSGCIHHSSKKLLLSGVRTGGKSAYKDIQEARDTLSRWLQLNESIS